MFNIHIVDCHSDSWFDHQSHCQGHCDCSTVLHLGTRHQVPGYQVPGTRYEGQSCFYTVIAALFCIKVPVPYQVYHGIWLCSDFDNSSSSCIPPPDWVLKAPEFWLRGFSVSGDIIWTQLRFYCEYFFTCCKQIRLIRNANNLLYCKLWIIGT